MRWSIPLVAVLVLTAGCFSQLGVGGEEGEDPATGTGEGGPGGDEATRTVEQERVFQANISQPRMGGDRLDIAWSTAFPVGLAGMHLALSWGEAANSFGIETERPDGTVHAMAPPGPAAETSTDTRVTQLVPGEYTYHLTAADGVVLPDTVELVVTATLELATTARPAVQEGTVREPVDVVETGDGYRASVVHRANATADDRVQVTVQTTNGAIEHDGRASQATGEVTAWALGDTAEAARQRVLAIDVDLVVESGRIEATASAPNWTRRGADVTTGVPEATTVHGTLDTTNGAIGLVKTRAGDLVAATTNGAIYGDVTGRGEFHLDTTNGRIDVSLAPTGVSDVQADTTNGAVLLGLTEGSSIAYEIDAETSNGRITESMSEAELEGSDEQATLVTQEGEDRAIQVTGHVDTTNGNVAFDGR